MIWLAAFSLLCAGGPALLFMVNLRAYRPPPPPADSRIGMAVLIPARDEAETIEKAVRAALGSGADEVLVLDDGSSDATPEIVEDLESALAEFSAVAQSLSGPAEAPADR